MAVEAIVDKAGCPVAGVVRRHGPALSEMDKRLGRFVRLVLTDEDVEAWRAGAVRLTESGKLAKVKGYVAPSDEDEPAVEPEKPKKPKKAKPAKKKAAPKKTAKKVR